ncbi:uncharacterized protein LOC119310792 [Triticum dicoccoides]|uniref:uncharacterized protein LOC119310792 n=1 Tax=Triticum dicoccoides TaxID=85692 RepID=UPI001891004F|nr:uncharacterized protein LOC119310792 [Triticum dicoccoides]
MYSSVLSITLAAADLPSLHSAGQGRRRAGQGAAAGARARRRTGGRSCINGAARNQRRYGREGGDGRKLGKGSSTRRRLPELVWRRGHTRVAPSLAAQTGRRRRTRGVVAATRWASEGRDHVAAGPGTAGGSGELTSIPISTTTPEKLGTVISLPRQDRRDLGSAMSASLN